VSWKRKVARTTVTKSCLNSKSWIREFF
jgi:hypothetical protein